MSEEEIIKEVDRAIYRLKEITDDEWFFEADKQCLQAIQGLLDLYNKEKLNSLNLSEQLNKEKEKNNEITIKNHLIKKESNAYREEIARSDNQLRAKKQEIEYLNYIIESDKDNYINKDKIRNLINYKENKLNQIKQTSDRYRQVCLQAEIDVLQELLKEVE